MSTRPLILILGMYHRSGTNFLWDLLQCHEGIEASPISEDYVVFEADRLTRFAEAVSRQWSSAWGIDPEEERRRLVRSLGWGIKRFFAETVKPGKRAVLKTPTVANVDLVFEVFPAAQVLLLVRDGRDVVESSLRSFGGGFERTLQRWKRNAHRIVRFLDSPTADESRYLLVRYEDLWRRTEREMRRILRFLGEDVYLYDYERALSLPVRGSSTYRGRRQRLHWEPVPRSGDFQPIGRWSEWGMFRRQRFRWVAGEELRRLGYPEAQQRPWWSGIFWPVNYLLDLSVTVALRTRRLFRR